MKFKIMASRHSAFYTPLLATVASLRDEGHDAVYSVLAPGQRGYALLREGAVDIMQSAVSSNWPLREQGIEPLPVHFAQINRRDGFFLVGRVPQPEFAWKDLEGKTLLADHGGQPNVMLRYAVKQNGADWTKIRVINAGPPEKMASAFRDGTADYVHLQGPIGCGGEIVAPVGAAMPPVAFSSLCCARTYQKTDAYRVFLDVFARAKEWALGAPAAEIAARLAGFFPDTTAELLADAVARYQALGCWQGGVEIPRELYEQALTVFQSMGAIAWRHSYTEVCG
jgi:ABC-type nitrate/sulfonate/bicarbonate transport system substrate-binding protein